jgi:hypothetical protein
MVPPIASMTNVNEVRASDWFQISRLVSIAATGRLAFTDLTPAGSR